MATVMTGTVALCADRWTVWAMLNDTAVLKSCIPGCRSVERESDSRFAVVVRVDVGPVGVAFRGHVTLSRRDPPNSFRLAGVGAGGLAGLASGVATIDLSDSPTGCVLRYAVRAGVEGRIAEAGGRVVDIIAGRLAAHFGAAFAAAVRSRHGLPRARERGATPLREAGSTRALSGADPKSGVPAA